MNQIVLKGVVDTEEEMSLMKRIAHITDLHLEEPFPIDHGVKATENLKTILDDVASRGITEVVFTGDIGTAEANQWFFDTVYKYPVSLKLTIGNHDLFSDTIKHYKGDLPKGRSELYYTDEGEQFKYIFLDSSTSKISDTQLNWFKTELITDKKVILFIHHPVLETNTAPQKHYPLEGNTKIKEALLSHNKEVIIFCGHLHMEDLQSEENIIQHVTPASCFQVKKQPDKTELNNISYGYRIIEVDNEQVSSEVIMFSN